jgi:hypothetical protein
LASLPGCIPGLVLTPPLGRPAFLADLGHITGAEAIRELRGDPGFSRERLGEEARTWYDALWAALKQPDQRTLLDRLASSDDLYQYGRTVHANVVALLTVFRFTGDLALLDEVDRLAEQMRASLADSWRGGAKSVRPGRDGYLNWVYRHSDGVHLGKDLHETNEMRTHALVAQFAWAFANNRDLTSPGGVDYGERADFWTGYLQNHFEKKWRERSGVRWPKFPFLSRPYVHPTTTFVKYHYYMYRLTGREPYAREAERLSGLVFDEFREVATDSVSALVWRRAIISGSMRGSTDYLMPTTYSDNVMSDAVDLYFEGFYGWRDERVLRGIATTLSEFVMDNGATDFARDIGGGVSRAGIRATSSREWERQTQQKYSAQAFALLSFWDEADKVRQVSRQVFEAMPPKHRYVFIPAGLFIDAVLSELAGTVAFH